MARPKEDLPPLLPDGEHLLTLEVLRQKCVHAFPLSETRAEIMRGLERIYAEIIRLQIPCDLVLDGSFLTEEINPDDIDFAVAVGHDFYESCSEEQRKYLDWIRDDFEIKNTHLCECYLSVEFPPSHPEYFDGIQNRAYWVRLYARSIIYKRVRGVAVIRIA